MKGGADRLQKIRKEPLPGIKEGIFSALLHFANEVVCFFALGRVFGGQSFLWLVAFLYDALAFLPQALIGYLADRFPKLRLGALGAGLLTLGFLPLALRTAGTLPALAVLSLGNACVHVSLAERTLNASRGTLTPSSVYVGAGAFGVVCGRILGASSCPFWLILLLSLGMLPAFLFFEKARPTGPDAASWDGRFRSPGRSDGAVILLAVSVVAVRSYMGNLIPTEWNRSTLTTVLLYVAMGLGKMLGGAAADRFGCRTTALISIAAALPFLLLGKRIMLISLIGILLFSMTMPLTLGALVSVLPDYPAVAFGLTTVGLFLGTLPGFFFRVESPLFGSAMIVVLSLLCLAASFLFLPQGIAAGPASSDSKSSP